LGLGIGRECLLKYFALLYNKFIVKFKFKHIKNARSVLLLTIRAFIVYRFTL
jgi:hypothetical protein